MMLKQRVFFFISIICLIFLNSILLFEHQNFILTQSYAIGNFSDSKANQTFEYLKHNQSNNETINPHDYFYIINPGESICKNKNITLLAFVLIKRDNFIQRDIIRTTWSNKTLFPQMRVVFMLGSSNDVELDKKIENESKIYGDIVQESFQDTYLNLTLKTIQGIKWVSNYCSNAKYVLKVDDDVVVNSFALLQYLDNLKLNTDNNLMCFIHKNAPINRKKDSKFYVSYNELSTNSYSKYCDGPAYMFEGNLTARLYEASLNTKFFKFEDVYFGLLAAKLNLNFIGLRYKYAFSININRLFESKRIVDTFFIFSFQQPELFRSTWSKLVNTFEDYEDFLFVIFSILFLIYFKLINKNQ
jgi:beta-1,3-galactosyltransferase 2